MPKPMLTFVALVGLLALPLFGVVVIGYLPAPITPNSSFFTLSIDGIPQINITQWTLKVDGDVNYPLTFTYGNLTALPNVSEVARLQCVSGPSGTANWTGVPLNDILEMAGVRPSAVSVIFYGADGYSSSLAWPKENTSDVLLAFGMNGVPLPANQGYPVRIVAPNELGYKWVMWVYHIQVVGYEYKGYWESLGWSNNAEIAAPTDWRLHATLLSISFIFGGLAAISGVSLSPTMAEFKDLPKFVSRRFHIVTSLLFVFSATVFFTYWVVATLLARGAVFYELHGIVGLVSIGLIVVGSAKSVSYFRHSGRKPSWHGRVSLYGFVLYLVTMFLGFALTAGGLGIA
jgi:hypothetical protein